MTGRTTKRKKHIKRKERNELTIQRVRQRNRENGRHKERNTKMQIRQTEKRNNTKQT